jgi:U4/U6.U5 tri-snRNP-associated protein 2
MPLFSKDALDRSLIPQVPLMALLQKFNGHNEHSLVSGERKKYMLTKLPRFLIIHVKRFTFNWFLEKNSTIVNFPLKHLDLRDCVHPDSLASVLSSSATTKYDLVASVRHEGPPSAGKYSVFVRSRGPAERWFEI